MTWSKFPRYLDGSMAGAKVFSCETRMISESWPAPDDVPHHLGERKRGRLSKVVPKGQCQLLRNAKTGVTKKEPRQRSKNSTCET